MNQPTTAYALRARRGTARAAAVVVTVLLPGCLALAPLPEHRPLVPSAGHGIVVGRIEVASGGTVVPPTNPGADPWSTGPAPVAELRVYLERLVPRSVSLPPVAGAGAFAWSLEPGDYLLLSLPEVDVDAPAIAQRFRPVAAFRVRAGMLTCVGGLRLEAEGPVVFDRKPLRVDPALERARVTDACGDIARDVAARYAPLETPAEIRLMTEVADLAFRDPHLFDEVRRRLDLADARPEGQRPAATPPDDRHRR